MLLYIGNKLSKYGNTPSSVEIVGELLKEHYTVLSVSDKRNQVWRLLHIITTIVRVRREVRLILIDTYSARGFYFALTTAVLARVFKLAYVPILRGGNLEMRLKNNPTLSKFVFTGAQVAGLIAPSSFMDTVFRRYGYEKLTYIPNNLSIDQYIFKRRESFRPRLLWVRSFNRIYNPRMAVDVLSQLRRRYPDATLCMVGPDKDGSLEACRQYGKDLGVEGGLTFTGGLSKAEWHALSEEYDIFINTATVDNTPVSVMEAMALGLPVVSSNVGGIPYLLTDRQNAFLVDSGDVDGMASRVDQLVQNPALARQMAQTARSKVESFDWKQVKYQWIKLIDEIISDHH